MRMARQREKEAEPCEGRTKMGVGITGPGVAICWVQLPVSKGPPLYLVENGQQRARGNAEAGRPKDFLK